MKLLASYLSGRTSRVCVSKIFAAVLCSSWSLQGHQRHSGVVQDDVMSTLADWLGDAACNRNPMVLLMAGMIHMHEGNYVEALKICHVGLTLEM